MKDVLTIPRTRFLAGLFTNLAAAWFGVAFIAPGFGGDFWRLTKDLAFAIVCSWLAIKFEERIP